MDQEKGLRIAWTPYGKVRSVTKGDGSKLEFRYDGAGNRIEKKMLNSNNTGKVTRYVRDASGNIMGIYAATITAGVEDALEMAEQPIYGSSRLGQYRGGRAHAMQTLGLKHYELTNHLGNVLSVVTDNINISPDCAFAKIVAATDYYAFGSENARPHLFLPSWSLPLWI
ncbi:MAG: hypothetical protein KF725_07075 [Cyclobacteriaceae bacterium]|nr:hypothetical protein [Cyclobacteriaceae bacterium]UYN88313.1 MAG: hypothetical protein KIT51_08730 [Cyclobacteriaceae bacterium]